MKKNKIARLAAVMLALTLVSTALMSGTIAKYTAGVTGSDTARVAKFAFNIKDDGTSIGDETSTTGTYDIFTYTDTGVYNNGVNSDKFIAPGTTGTIPVTVENLSEVDVAVTFGLTETNANKIPVYYTVGSETQRYSSVLTGEYSDGRSYQDIAALATAMAGATLEATEGTTASAGTYTLNWTWAFESAGEGQTDASDTALGVAYDTPATVELGITATVTQVND